MAKFSRPAFLPTGCDQATYTKWLARTAPRHAKRDRERGNLKATKARYTAAFHDAVIVSAGRDAYTGDQLDWSLICTYCNTKSKAGRRAYKATFALMPSVDHVGDGMGPADFKICGWRTNDAKHDLTYDAFVTLCRRVIEFADSSNSLSGG